jgi:hypothetical protein
MEPKSEHVLLASWLSKMFYKREGGGCDYLE